MSTEDNIAAFRKLIEVGFTQDDFSVVEELVSPAGSSTKEGTSQASRARRQRSRPFTTGSRTSSSPSSSSQPTAIPSGRSTAPEA